ncbi:MAG: SDR family oxidoreductase [Planctomycetia bacterium]|nr:SDR family oxidoreductase [Planctomycetia bacterium]
MNRSPLIRTVYVTGGGGYVGAVLIPKLLAAGYHVRCLDLFLYGEDVFPTVARQASLELIRGDLRDQALLRRTLAGSDAVIHLACISNDPSFELDPALGKSINYDSFRPLVELSRAAGVRRFIYASSSSVYGVKQEANVTEELALEPLTDYSRFKAACEAILAEYQAPDFTTVTLRPATVCGYSPRLRLDLSVNILTNHAYSNGRIRVFGGNQYRPNIHIDDVTDLYVRLLTLDAELVAGRTWNAGYENQTINDIAAHVREVVVREPGHELVAIAHEPTDDQRSYRISSEKIRRDIGFVPKHSIAEAAADLVAAFRAGKVPNPMHDPKYYNIKTMQALSLR